MHKVKSLTCDFRLMLTIIPPHTAENRMSTKTVERKLSDILQITATPDGISDIEWQTRVNLAAAYRLVHIHGWTSQVYNHITARIPGTEELLIL